MRRLPAITALFKNGGDSKLVPRNRTRVISTRSWMVSIDESIHQDEMATVEYSMLVRTTNMDVLVCGSR